MLGGLAPRSGAEGPAGAVCASCPILYRNTNEPYGTILRTADITVRACVGVCVTVPWVPHASRLRVTLDTPPAEKHRGINHSVAWGIHVHIRANHPNKA